LRVDRNLRYARLDQLFSVLDAPQRLVTHICLLLVEVVTTFEQALVHARDVRFNLPEFRVQFAQHPLLERLHLVPKHRHSHEVTVLLLEFGDASSVVLDGALYFHEAAAHQLQHLLEVVD
jgi:hypothetical protein